MSQFPLLWAIVVQEDEEEEEELCDQQLWIEISCVRLATRVRNYVTAAALPRPFESPWAMLDRYGDDTDFMAMMRLNRAAFDALVVPFTRNYEVRSGPGRSGRPTRLQNYRAALTLVLQFYGSLSDLKHLCSVFLIPPDTASRCLAKAEEALSLALDSVADAEVCWPTAREQVEWGRMVENREPLVTKKFGFIDGKNYQVHQPSRAEVQNAYYNGWLHSVLVTGTLDFGVDCCIFWMKHNCQGSWNDRETRWEFRQKLCDPFFTLKKHGVLSDSAFPVSGVMSGKIVTPLKWGDLERAVRMGGNEEAIRQIQNAVTSILQAAEWGMGAVGKAFPRLLNTLPWNPDVRRVLLDNIHRLYNYRVRMSFVRQIRNVFAIKSTV
ncbi:hypothetical protein PsorP6_018002 [Peronosclerospora sorghi]|uniref:Uncharacterized protein n=1 Tax=Peronosclerospora sorghi TaxID=230839 RepID=A0ACC0WBI2_9STRA|nr:hypothetical protein PsorP6_018002 [Peronosclerospora sorghi]